MKTLKSIFLGIPYSDEEITSLLENYQRGRLNISFLKDHGDIEKVYFVYSLNEWTDDEGDFPEIELIYDEDRLEYRGTVDFGSSPSVCFRFRIHEGNGVIRWEDRNKKNWFVNTSVKINFERISNIERKCAELISEGKIIAWFQGGSEFGPRALGHRSILADPRDPDMKDKLNRYIKHREEFRPFAPSVLKEYQSEYFELSDDSPYMLLTSLVHEEKRSLIPAVVHVDGTARLQTVSRDFEQRFYDLIREFYSITGIPMVLNTSFNDADEPIVESPFDALCTFLNTGIDNLAMHDYLISKNYD